MRIYLPFFYKIFTLFSMIDLDGFCKRLGITVKDLSDEVGLAQSTIYKWKMDRSKGGASPSYEIIKRLLEMWVTIEELFGIDCRPHCPNAQGVPPPVQVSDPLANSPIMRDLLRRMDALEQRTGRESKVG